VLLLVATAGEDTLGEVCHPLDAGKGDGSGDIVIVPLPIVVIRIGDIDGDRSFSKAVAADWGSNVATAMSLLDSTSDLLSEPK